MADSAIPIDRILALLQAIPEKKLAIIDLANQLPIEYGGFSPQALDERWEEVQLAINEAEEYWKHTSAAVKLLSRIKVV